MANVLITGASSGIGLATALDLARAGHTVIATMRHPERAPGLAEIAAFVDTMNTNYLGAVRCMKAVLPGMREARGGCIVNVSSVSGRIACSPLGPYAASKFALEAISEALAGEVKPFHIRVAIVEPGVQDTKMARNIEKPGPSAYPHSARFAGLFRASLANPTPPETTAAVIRHIVESGTWQLRHPWYEAVQRDFGMDARLESRGAGADR